MHNLYIPACSLVLSVFLIILYVKKAAKIKEENIYYFGMIINTFLMTVFCLIAVFLLATGSSNEPIIILANKLQCISIINFFTNLIMYVFHASNICIKSLKIGYVFVNIALAIAIFASPVILDVTNDYNYMVSRGLAIDITTIASGVLLVIAFLISFKYRKILKEKMLPIVMLLLFIVLTIIIRSIVPEIIVLEFMATFATLIMYFTIENPDLKMLREKELARAQAEKANQAKSDFLSSMSHEIRTPLNAIVGFSEITLEDEEINIKEAKENIKEVVKASNVLLEIINGVLDIAKIESGNIEINNQDYNPIEMINNTCKMINIRIKEKELGFQINVAPDLPSVLHGDFPKIQQVLINLLNNAVKYTTEGKVTLTVKCINKADNCSLFISVEDTGRGIKTEQVDKLFENFTRLEEDMNTTIEGTGLGLAISRNLVEMMGGKITVQTMYGMGSQFTVAINQKIKDMNVNTIPVYNPKAKEKEESLVDVEATNIDQLKRDDIEELEIIGVDTEEVLTENNVNRKRILVVDDNKLNLKIISKILKQSDLSVTECETPFQVLDKIANGEKFDLILADDMMPKMTGTEMMKKLKSKGYQTPIVVLTANAKVGDREKYLDVGFEDYLGKPIDRKELDRVLNEYLFKGK